MKRALLGLLASVLAVSSCKSLDSVRPQGATPVPLARERPQLGPNEIAVTWLGAAGVLVRSRTKTVAIDPYVTRANAVNLVLGNLRADEDAINQYIPKVDLVLVGHSHADHVLDVPYLARRDGADVVGSLTTGNIVQSYGVPKEKVHVVGGGDLLKVNGVTVNAVRAGHGGWPLGKHPLPGAMERRTSAPLRATEFKMGGALFYRFIVDGIRVGHLSSGALGKVMPRDLGVDVLLVSLAASKDKSQVLSELLERTNPKVVMPIHWDIFFLGLEQSPRRLPGYDVEDVAVQVSTLAPKAATIIPAPMREFVINVETRKYR